MTRALRQLVKWFYLLCAFLLIALAVAVQSGRSFSHLLGDYTQDIASYLSTTFNARVAIKRIDASWDGLKPSLDLQQLSIHSPTGEPILAFERARIRLDMLGSLLNQRWVWSNVILSDVQMDFAQQTSGKWQVNGLPAPAKEQDEASAGVRLGSLMDMLLLSNRIEFQGSRLGFQFVDGRQVQLNTPLLLLENAGDFHRLSLQVDVDGEARRVYLMLEGKGDPREPEDFHTRGYLQLNQFPTSEPIAALNAFLLHGTAHTQLNAEGNINANIWFESRPGFDGFDVSGNISVQRLLVPFAGRQLQLDGFTSDLTGYWLYSGQWHLGIQELAVEYRKHALKDLNLGLSYAATQQPLQMRMNHLDLAELAALLEDAGTLGSGRLQEVIKTLKPQGQLSNLRLDLPLAEPSKWQLHANVNSLAVNAWRGSPSLTGVDGYVQLCKRGGFLNLDTHAGFSMHFIPSYPQPMAYDRVQGQIAWHLDPANNQIYVNSGPLKFYQGEEFVTGYMWLFMPWQRNTGDIDLYLHLGGRELGASSYRKYLPALAPESLRTWLDQSVGEQNPGVARKVGFIYRATLNSKDPGDRSFDLYLDLVRSKLDYSSGWPALENLSGRLLVSNASLKAQVTRAQVYESQIDSALVTMEPRQQGKGSLLQVKGQISGSATDGMRVLREGILRRHIGSNMDSWFLLGDMHTSLNLAIPLGTGLAKPADAFHRVDVDLQARSFELKNLNLNLDNLQGRISYTSDKGLSSQGLTGQLFDEPVSAELSTRQLADYSQTHIKIEGAVESQVLAAWSKRPEILFLEGKLPYVTQVELNHRPRLEPVEDAPGVDISDTQAFTQQAFAKVSFTSNLRGVKVDLPGVYRKSAKSQRPLAFSWWLQEHQSQAALEYAGKVQALFRLDRQADNTLLNANIALDKPAALGTTPEFLVTGHLAEFDLEAWQKVLSRYQGFRQQLGIDADQVQEDPDPRKIAGLVFRSDLVLGHYDIGSLRLENLAVIAGRDQAGWQLKLGNPVLEGNILIPESASIPLQIDLEYLRLTSQQLGLDAQVSDAENPEAPVAPSPKKTSVDPRKLPLANIAVKQLSLDEAPYGNWSLQLRPNTNGVVIDKIHGSIRGMTVNGANELPDGAKIIWQQDEQGQKTRFIGGISAGDIAEVMRQWGKPDTLESKAARFVADLYWSGGPQDFKLVDINGDMRLHFETGRFKRNASAEDGLLRLLSILNFDSLARRMRLDFSDLYQSGLAYDQINGKLHFNQGMMEFAEPLEVRGPSSRLQMVGSIDLRRERINTRLIATLPVAGNLTFFTALVTGLPAAAGIYVVSKLFKKQVDQVTSISYSIKGGWDDPKMRFDRLFESEDSLRDSVKSKTPNTRLRRPEEDEAEASSS